MIKEGGKERRQRTNFDGIMDALATAEGGTYLTLCYVSGAKVGKTLTGKNIDVDQFGQDIDQYQQKGTRGYDVLKNFHLVLKLVTEKKNMIRSKTSVAVVCP